MYKNKKIGLVIPCYKVSGIINDVIKKIPNFIDKIYLVDDNCPENSVKKVKSKILPKVQGLVPSNQTEAGRDAARFTGSSIGKAYLEYPSVVYINLLGVNEDHYPRFKPCMCSNITINYAEGNMMTIAEGGVPMGVSIQMAFQELEIQTAEDYDATPNNDVSFKLVDEIAEANEEEGTGTTDG